MNVTVVTVLNGWAALWVPCMLQACWQGALAVAGVWVICRFFTRLPPALRAGLWWLAYLKSLISLAFAGPVPLPVLPAADRDSPPSLRLPTTHLPTVSVLKGTIPTRLPEESELTSTDKRLFSRSSSLSLNGVIFCLWFAGVSYFLMGVGIHLRRVRRLVQLARPCDEPAAPAIAPALGLRCSPPILVSDRIDCSLVLGPWRPVVVLSQTDRERLSSDELRLLLAHELAHVRRQDLWAGLLPNLTRLLFFFNPLIWLACREYELARESACDAEALRVSGMPPATYGHLLLKLGTAATQNSGLALGAAAPYGMLRRRLQGLGSVSFTLPRWRAGLTLASAVGLLSLNPVRAKITQSVPTLIPSTKSSLPVASIRSQAGKTISVSAIKVSVVPAVATEVVARPTVTLPIPAAPLPPAMPARKIPILPFPALLHPRSPAALSADKDGLTKSTGLSHEVQQKKEEKRMSYPLKPKLSAALAVAATGAPVLLAATPSAAQVPPAPVPPTPAATTAEAAVYQYTVRLGDGYIVQTQDSTVG